MTASPIERSAQEIVEVDEVDEAAEPRPTQPGHSPGITVEQLAAAAKVIEAEVAKFRGRGQTSGA
jgi:hypothetical protein